MKGQIIDQQHFARAFADLTEILGKETMAKFTEISTLPDMDALMKEKIGRLEDLRKECGALVGDEKQAKELMASADNNLKDQLTEAIAALTPLWTVARLSFHDILASLDMAQASEAKLKEQVDTLDKDVNILIAKKTAIEKELETSKEEPQRLTTEHGEKMKTLREQLEAANKGRETVDAEFEKLTTKNATQIERIQFLLDQQLDASREALNAHDEAATMHNQLQEENHALKSAKQSLTERIAWLEANSQNDEAAARLEQAISRLDAAKAGEIETLKTQLQTEKGTVTQQKTTIAAHEKEIAEQKADVAKYNKLQVEHTKLETTANKATIENLRLAGAQTVLDARLDALKTTCESTDGALRVQFEKFDRIDTQRAAAVSAKEDIQRELSKTTIELAHATEQQKVSDNEILNLKASVEALTVSQETQNSMTHGIANIYTTVTTLSKGSLDYQKEDDRRHNTLMANVGEAIKGDTATREALTGEVKGLAQALTDFRGATETHQETSESRHATVTTQVQAVLAKLDASDKTATAASDRLEALVQQNGKDVQDSIKDSRQHHKQELADLDQALTNARAESTSKFDMVIKSLKLTVEWYEAQPAKFDESLNAAMTAAHEKLEKGMVDRDGELRKLVSEGQKTVENIESTMLIEIKALQQDKIDAAKQLATVREHVKNLTTQLSIAKEDSKTAASERRKAEDNVTKLETQNVELGKASLAAKQQYTDLREALKTVETSMATNDSVKQAATDSARQLTQIAAESAQQLQQATSSTTTQVEAATTTTNAKIEQVTKTTTLRMNEIATATDNKLEEVTAAVKEQSKTREELSEQRKRADNLEIANRDVRQQLEGQKQATKNAKAEAVRQLAELQQAKETVDDDLATARTQLADNAQLLCEAEQLDKDQKFDYDQLRKMFDSNAQTAETNSQGYIRHAERITEVRTELNQAKVTIRRLEGEEAVRKALEEQMAIDTAHFKAVKRRMYKAFRDLVRQREPGVPDETEEQEEQEESEESEDSDDPENLKEPKEPSHTQRDVEMRDDEPKSSTSQVFQAAGEAKANFYKSEKALETMRKEHKTAVAATARARTALENAHKDLANSEAEHEETARVLTAALCDIARACDVDEGAMADDELRQEALRQILQAVGEKVAEAADCEVYKERNQTLRTNIAVARSNLAGAKKSLQKAEQVHDQHKAGRESANARITALCVKIDSLRSEMGELEFEATTLLGVAGRDTKQIRKLLRQASRV